MRRSLACTLAISLLACASAYANDGNYDVGYGESGRVVHGAGCGERSRAASLMLADGRLLFTATSTNGLQSGRIVVFMVRPDGSYDTGFGTDGTGIVELPPLGVNNVALALARTAGGRFLVLGGDVGTGQVHELTQTGLVTQSSEFNFNYATGAPAPGVPETIVGLPNGKLLVAGGLITANGEDFAIARLNENLTRDTSFGTLGTYSEGFGFSGLGADRALALQLTGGGRILVAGNSRDTATGRLNAVVLQLLENGVPDSDFGNFGAIYFTNGTRSAAVQALRVDGLGRILVGGWIDGVNTADLWIHRLLPTGGSDFGFGAGANAVIPFDLTGAAATDLEAIAAMDLDAQGRILAGGIAIRNAATQQHAAVIARLGANGVLDPSFDNGGRFVGTFTPPQMASDDQGNRAFGIHATASGVVMTGASASPGPGFVRYCTATLRLGGDVQLRSSFEDGEGP